MTFSAKTLFNGVNLALQNDLVMGLCIYITKGLMDFLNRNFFLGHLDKPSSITNIIMLTTYKQKPRIISLA